MQKINTFINFLKLNEEFVVVEIKSDELLMIE
jgi:hypothetical protein